MGLRHPPATLVQLTLSMSVSRIATFDSSVSSAYSKLSALKLVSTWDTSAYDARLTTLIHMWRSF